MEPGDLVPMSGLELRNWFRLHKGLTKKVFDGAENRVNDILSPSPTREGHPF